MIVAGLADLRERRPVQRRLGTPPSPAKPRAQGFVSAAGSRSADSGWFPNDPLGAVGLQGQDIGNGYLADSRHKATEGRLLD